MLQLQYIHLALLYAVSGVVRNMDKINHSIGLLYFLIYIDLLSLLYKSTPFDVLSSLL